MARTPQDVTAAELSVLEALWSRTAATVRQLTEKLYPASSSARNATVQKLLERLEAKGCVSRDRDEWPHQFHAVVDRQDLIGRQLQSTADRLCNGSLQPLLLHLMQTQRMTAEERDALRQVLDELDE